MGHKNTPHDCTRAGLHSASTSRAQARAPPPRRPRLPASSAAALTRPGPLFLASPKRRAGGRVNRGSNGLRGYLGR